MIKAIETRYSGYRFRSRLEARWAVFFNELHLKWEYEPEGFSFNGQSYLPDFKINLAEEDGITTYVEVKGDTSKFDTKRYIEFLESCGDSYVMLLLASIPDVSKGSPQHVILTHYKGVHIGCYSFGYPIFPAFDHVNKQRLMMPKFEYHQELLGEGGIYTGYVTYITKNGKQRLDQILDGEYIPWAKEPCSSPSIDGVVMSAYIAARSARFEHGENG